MNECTQTWEKYVFIVFIMNIQDFWYDITFEGHAINTAEDDYLSWEDICRCWILVTFSIVIFSPWIKIWNPFGQRKDWNFHIIKFKFYLAKIQPNFTGVSLYVQMHCQGKRSSCYFHLLLLWQHWHGLKCKTGERDLVSTPVAWIPCSNTSNIHNKLREGCDTCNYSRWDQGLQQRIRVP